MKPVHQTILNGPSDKPEERGDCYRACIASIFELPIEVVPHFLAIDGDDDAWWDAVQGFMGGFGLNATWLGRKEHGEAYMDHRPEGYWIASVTSPRAPAGSSFNHCVVMRGDRLVHDPWPHADGKLTELVQDDLQSVEWFTAIDPAVAVRGAKAVFSCTCPVGFGAVVDPNCPRHGQRNPAHTITGAGT